MFHDYMPRPDNEFNSWQRNFLDFLAAHAGEVNVDPGDLPPLTDAQDRWQRALEAHVAAHAAAQAAASEKDAARADYVAQIRATVRAIQAYHKTSDVNREGLGITVRDAIRTAAPAPATRPVVQVDSAQRLQHSLRIFDEAAGLRRARPKGVMGAEVWHALDAMPRQSRSGRAATAASPGSAVADAQAAAPGDPSQFRFVTLATRSSAQIEYAASDSGRTAHYIARWVSTRGAKGPWSETASATVGG